MEATFSDAVAHLGLEQCETGLEAGVAMAAARRKGMSKSQRAMVQASGPLPSPIPATAPSYFSTPKGKHLDDAMRKVEQGPARELAYQPQCKQARCCGH